MHKIFFVFIILIFGVNFAVATPFTEDTPDACVFSSPTAYLGAIWEKTRYTCASGYYLPANHEGCVPCPLTHECTGGTFSFNEKISQGLKKLTPVSTNINNFCATNIPVYLSAQFEPNTHICSAGYYLPANIDACAQCPSGNACIGGTYSFNETTDQGIQSCAVGTFAPTGSAVCYPHILHVGDNVVYLKSTKQTTPSLNVRIGNDTFYANMTTIRTTMNKDSSRYLRVQWPDNDYYVCDDTTCPAE